MTNKAEWARHYRRRAEEVRLIALGLFDQEEREILMELAEDCESWALVVGAESRAGTA